MKDKVIFVNIKKENHWGITDEWIKKSEKVKISDIEKTIIDCLAYPEYCGGITEIAKGIWIKKDEIDYKLL